MRLWVERRYEGVDDWVGRDVYAKKVAKWGFADMAGCARSFGAFGLFDLFGPGPLGIFEFFCKR